MSGSCEPIYGEFLKYFTDFMDKSDANKSIKIKFPPLMFKHDALYEYSLIFRDKIREGPHIKTKSTFVAIS